MKSRHSFNGKNLKYKKVVNVLLSWLTSQHTDARIIHTRATKHFFLTLCAISNDVSILNAFL